MFAWIYSGNSGFLPQSRHADKVNWRYKIACDCVQYKLAYWIIVFCHECNQSVKYDVKIENKNLFQWNFRMPHCFKTLTWQSQLCYKCSKFASWSFIISSLNKPHYGRVLLKFFFAIIYPWTFCKFMVISLIQLIWGHEGFGKPFSFIVTKTISKLPARQALGVVDQQKVGNWHCWGQVQEHEWAQIWAQHELVGKDSGWNKWHPSFSHTV